MFRYTLSKISMLGIILFAIGCFFTVQGILIRSHLSFVKHSYEQSEIKTGRFWECDITREQLMGNYVPLLTEMIDNDGTCHLFGKFEKSARTLTEKDYDIIKKDTNAADKETVDQMVSTKYRIKVTDPNKEKVVLYKGLSLLVIGGAAFAWGIGREKVVDETAPHRQPWDLV